MPYGPNTVEQSNRFVEWQIPPHEVEGYYLKGWIDELVQGGDKWLRNQPGIRHVSEDIRLLTGVGQERTLRSNSLQNKIRTFVETITDLGQIATLASNAPQFQPIVSLYNEIFKFIFWDSNFVFKSRQAMQYAMVGRGYLYTRFIRDNYGWGEGRMQFDALGPLDVLPEQLPPDNDVTGSYACTIIRPMPIAEAHGRFPAFQGQITPISRTDWGKYSSMGGGRLDMWDRFRFGEAKDFNWDSRYAEIRTTFVRDMRVNDTGRTIAMGEPGSTWYYEVPSLGDLIVTTNPFNGLPESREADLEDCRLYPQLRCVITCPSVPVPLYDGPAYNWHGSIPLAQYDVIDWAWSGMGYSAVHAVGSLERERRERLSELNDILAVRKDPPTAYSTRQGVPRDQMAKLDLLRSQGIRIGVNEDPSKALRSVLPESMQVDGEDWKAQEMFNAQIDEGLGLKDITSLTEMKANLSSETVDKFLENLGPMAKGIAINMWMAHNKISHYMKYNIAQYVSVNDLMAMVGPEGLRMETFDSDPNSLVPDRLPDELPDAASRYSKMQRAHWFLKRLKTVSKPSQILNITQQQERMLYMMFLQKGMKIPTETVMEKLGVQGYKNEEEKWREEKESDALWQLEVQKAVAVKQHELGLDPPPPPQGGGSGAGQGQGGGRPSTMKKPNRAVQKGSKDGEVRVVNSTS